MANKIFILLCCFFMLGVSCNLFSSRNKPHTVLLEYSLIDFPKQEIDVIKFEEKRAGIAEEVSLLAIYKINDKFNIDSLKKNNLLLNYLELPVPHMDMGNGFDGNLKQGDKGYYKYKCYDSPFKDDLVIINFTQKKIIISANW